MTLRISCLIFSAGMLALTSCSDAPKATEASTEAPKAAAPSEPVTAKTAFWPMYKEAYAWSRDIVPLTLEPKALPGYKMEAGKAPMWTAVFASPSRKEMHTWTYSITKYEDTPRGVSVSQAVAWAGPRHEAMPFATGDLGVDSDAAYKTAAAAAVPFTTKHPDAPVTYSLGNATRFPAPVWYFLWGNNKLGYAAYVNSHTGELMNTKK